MSSEVIKRVVLLPDRVIGGKSAQAIENMAVLVEGQTITALVQQDGIL